jgi:TonB-dependent Receptor Plug Domain
MAAGVQRVVRLAGLDARAPARSSALGLQGFYDRQKLGHGVFLTDRQLQANPAGRLSSVLRMVPGVHVVQRREVPPVALAQGNRGVRCLMDVYLDGVLVAGRALGERSSMSLDATALGQVEGVEVFRGAAEIPIQYRTGTSACGVILMWTRHR